MIFHSFFLFFQYSRPYEYDLLTWISNHHNIILNNFFFTGTLLGSELFYMLLIPFIFALFDKDKACLISSFILFSLLLNSLIKIGFAIPRPDNSIVEPLYTSFAKGFSFPSGHAQGSITLWGIIAYHVKKDIKKILLCLFMVLWISLSRIYLCVHFPADIIGGWILGIIVVSLYIVMNTKVKKLPHLFLFYLFTLLIIIFHQSGITKISSVLCGIHLGMFISNKYRINYEISPIKISLKLFIMFMGSGLIYGIFSFFNITSFLKYGIIGFWFSLMYPYTVTRIASLSFGNHD